MMKEAEMEGLAWFMPALELIMVRRGNVAALGKHAAIRKL